MPLYEYKCSRCGEKFEELVQSSSNQDQVNCPQCQSESVQRLYSAFGRLGRETSMGSPIDFCSPYVGGS